MPPKRIIVAQLRKDGWRGHRTELKPQPKSKVLRDEVCHAKKASLVRRELHHPRLCRCNAYFSDGSIRGANGGEGGLNGKAKEVKRKEIATFCPCRAALLLAPLRKPSTLDLAVIPVNRRESAPQALGMTPES